MFVALSILALLGVYAVLWNAQAAQNGGPLPSDRAILLAVHARANPVLDALTYAMAFLGSLWVAFGVALGCIILSLRLRGRQSAASDADRVLRDAGRILPIACVGGTLIVEIAKFFAHRARPQVFTPLFHGVGYSFPSGHSLMGTVIYGLIAVFAYREAARRNARVASRIALPAGFVLLSLCIGVSRVYAGVHFPTDVLAGWTGGAAWVLVCLRLPHALKHGPPAPQ